MGQPKSQPEYRRSIVAKDQFGRPWLMQIELATGAPVGGVIAAGWTDPLRTAQRHIVVPKDEYNQPLWGRCFIDFATWMGSVKAADKEWGQRLNEAGVMQYKNKFKPQEARMDSYLLELAGPEPWPSLECLEAARTGDKHLLGQVKNEHGQSILDEDAKRLMGYKNIDLDPEPVDPDEFNFQHAKFKSLGPVAGEDVSMAPEEVITVTGTSKEDFQEFMKQGTKAGLPYPLRLLAWKEHKEMVAAKEA